MKLDISDDDLRDMHNIGTVGHLTVDSVAGLAKVMACVDSRISLYWRYAPENTTRCCCTVLSWKFNTDGGIEAIIDSGLITNYDFYIMPAMFFDENYASSLAIKYAEVLVRKEQQDRADFERLSKKFGDIKS